MPNHEPKVVHVTFEVYADNKQKIKLMKTIKGEVIKMGTMHLNYEEVTGVFVECSETDLKKLSTNLMYKKVQVQDQMDIIQYDGKETGENNAKI